MGGVKTSSVDRDEALEHARRIVAESDAGDAMPWLAEDFVTETVNLARSYIDLDDTARDFLDNHNCASSVSAQERPKMPDAKLVGDGRWLRAGGACVCETCGFEYRDHDTVRGFRWLHRLCDGRLVKL